jgi:hypothetical protein
MMVDKISAVGTEIRLMSLGEGEIRLKLVGARISGALMLPNAFTLDTQYLVKDGSPFPYPGPTQRLRLNVMPENNSAQYSGDGSLLFDFELGQSGDHSGPLISSFPIDRIEFEGEARDASTISGQGSISYPECPRTAPVMLQANDVLTLQDLNEFYLREVALTEPATSLRIKADGIAGQIMSGSNGALQDRRLTRFDLLWNNQRLVALFTALSWLVATSLALRKYLKESSGE